MKNYLALITPKRAIIICIGIVVIGALIASTQSKEEDAEANEQKIKIVDIVTIEKQDTVTSGLTVSGTAIPREYSNVRSLSQGTVEFLVPVGVEVVRGQSLFSIRDANVESAYFNALDQFNATEVATEQRVVQAELAVASKEAALIFAEKSLETSKKRAIQRQSTSQASAITAYNSAYNSLTQILNSLSSGSISFTSNYIYSDILTTDSQLRSTARSQFDVAVAAYQKIDTNVSAGTIEPALDRMLTALNETKTLLDATVIILKTAVNDSYASQLAQAQTYQTANNTHITSVIASRDAIKSSSIENEYSVEQDENRVSLAKIELDNAKTALDSAKASAVTENSSVRSRLDSAAYNYANLTLASPFSGTVLGHHVRAGEQVSVGQEMIEVGNLDIVEVSVDVDASFAKALRVRDNVVINGTVPGYISEIEPVANINSGKVGITVQSREGVLVTGDIAEVKFDLIFESPDSIIIPIKAATIEEVRTVVYVEKDGVAAEREVTLGDIFGDKVRVTSGLEAGDRLIIPNGTFIAEGDLVTKPSE